MCQAECSLQLAGTRSCRQVDNGVSSHFQKAKEDEEEGKRIQETLSGNMIDLSNYLPSWGCFVERNKCCCFEGQARAKRGQAKSQASLIQAICLVIGSPYAILESYYRIRWKINTGRRDHC